MMYKSIKDFPLYEDINHIQTSRDNISPEWLLDIVLHTERDEITSHGIWSHDIISDYENGYTDVIYIKANFILSEVVYNVIPFRDMLEAELIVGDVSQRYRAILPNDAIQLSHQMLQNSSRRSLDEIGMIPLTLQLVELHGEPSKMAVTRGVFKGKLDVILANVFKQAMSYYTVEGEKLATKVRVVEADNEKEYEQVVLPSNLKVLDLPDYLQAQHGIYLHGIGRYLTYDKGKPVWDIYPTTDPLRYDTLKTKTRIFLIPPGLVTDMTSSWYYENNTFNIIAGEDAKESGALDTRPVTRPTGYIFSDSDKFINNDIDSSSGIPMGSGTAVTKPVVFTPTPDGLDLKSNLGHAANKHVLTSKVNSDYMRKKQVIWRGSNPFHITPGLPIMLYKVYNGHIETYYASVTGTHTVFSGDGKKDVNGFLSTTVINLSILDRL